MKKARAVGPPATVTGLMFARQLEVRYVASVEVPCGGSLHKAHDIAEVLKPIMARRVQEVLVVLHLDARHRLIGWEEAAKGAINVLHVSARDILRSALAVNAAAIIVAHNHPSGDPTPSTDDVALTTYLRAATELVGIPLLDHLIVSDEGFFSFTDGRISRPG